LNKKTAAGGNVYTTKLRSVEPDHTDVLSKMRQFIRASNRTLKEIFDEIDQSGQGVVTNLEFKEGIRKLMIGITSKEIDDLINVVDMNKDGRVDWVEFNAKFKQL
jgi:Ca2+-binding EF-hand superfamily protein